MSGRRRLATLLVVSLILAGLLFLFRDAASSRTLTYDLGEEHSEVVRLEVRITLDDEIVRRVEWRFPEGTAPRRVAHEPTLPARVMSVLIEIESTGGDLRQERRELDGREAGDVILHLGSPSGAE